MFDYLKAARRGILHLESTNSSSRELCAVEQHHQQEQALLFTSSIECRPKKYDKGGN